MTVITARQPQEAIMCDYSLEAYRSRPAREGERYVTTRFETGSIGLTSPNDCSTAVCVPYDTKLRLEGIPEDVQRSFGVGREEDVTFVRLEIGPHHDGVKFRTGAEIPLYVLKQGVTAAITEALTGLALRIGATVTV